MMVYLAQGHLLDHARAAPKLSEWAFLSMSTFMLPLR